MGIKGLSVQDLLNEKAGEIASISIDAKLPEVARTLADRKIGVLLVLKDEKFAGVVSERDIARALGYQGAAAAEMSVKDVVTQNITACAPNTHLDEVLDTMKRMMIRHMPVIENGRIRGVLSIGDVLGHLLAESSKEEKSGGLKRLLGR